MQTASQAHASAAWTHSHCEAHPAAAVPTARIPSFMVPPERRHFSTPTAYRIVAAIASISACSISARDVSHVPHALGHSANPLSPTVAAVTDDAENCLKSRTICGDNPPLTHRPASSPPPRAHHGGTNAESPRPL